MTLVELLRPKTSSAFRLNFYEGFRRVSALTPQEIDEKSHVVARALIEQGRMAEPVVLSLANGPEFVICFFAILKAQCIPVPVASPSYMSEYSFRQLKEHLHAVLGDCLWISKDGDGISPKDLQPRNQGVQIPSGHQETALIQFSSGSTHDPKGVVLTHAQILANMKQIKGGMRVSSEDVLSSWLPFYHDMGLIGGVLSALYNQVEAHFMSPADFLASPTKWLQHVAKTKTTIIMGPNLLYRHLLRRVRKQHLEGLDLSSIRLSLCGAEPVQHRLLNQVADHLAIARYQKNSLFPVYGMAENCLAVSFPDCGQGLRTKKFADSELVSCGKALEGIEIRIVDEQGQILSDGNLGEIQYRSPSMTDGYFQNAEATAALFVDGWLRSGDLGFVQDSEVYIAGRSKEVIILNGKKYFPQDMEERVSLLQDPVLGRALAFQIFGESGYRIAVETKQWRPWRRAELRERISQVLQKWTWETPSHVHLVAPCALPRTSSGKLKRAMMRGAEMKQWILSQERQYFMQLFQSYLQRAKMIGKYLLSKSEIAPKKDLVETIVRVSFADILGIAASEVDMEKSFFSYNMESVHVVQLNVSLQEKFTRQGHQAEISLHDFIQLKNLQELCQYLKDNGYHALQAKEGIYDQEFTRKSTRRVSGESEHSEVQTSV